MYPALSVCRGPTAHGVCRIHWRLAGSERGLEMLQGVQQLDGAGTDHARPDGERLGRPSGVRTASGGCGRRLSRECGGIRQYSARNTAVARRPAERRPLAGWPLIDHGHGGDGNFILGGEEPTMAVTNCPTRYRPPVLFTQPITSAVCWLGSMIRPIRSNWPDKISPSSVPSRTFQRR